TIPLRPMAYCGTVIAVPILLTQTTAVCATMAQSRHGTECAVCRNEHLTFVPILVVSWVFPRKRHKGVGTAMATNPAGAEQRLTSGVHPADVHNVIRVQGARENNLKNISLEIPKRRLTVFTGVSGSG